eukprot:TRINITY_DN5605_c0_g1_i5.p1 TRINITY_DN5605_c0_g1~~TRINITY_DN5605_c0_g1_i5.p1  ORF type:complete len:122 (+),score=8.05 TRINITY_DN5605_c0_g1_i5:108-473(+)
MWKGSRTLFADQDESTQWSILGCLSGSALFLHLIACFIYNTYWPMFIFLAYAVVPVPMIILSESPSDYYFLRTEESSYENVALFLTAALGSSFIGNLKTLYKLSHNTKHKLTHSFICLCLE